MSTTRERLRIGPADHGRAMSLHEFVGAEEQPGHLYDLARGVLEAVEVPSEDHFQVVHNLHELISRFCQGNPGSVLGIGHGSDIRILLPELETDRHPDLGVVFHDASRDPRGRRRADLVVEVVSPGRSARERDCVAKREEYLLYGLAEYWIVDPERRQVTVLVRQGEGTNASWLESVFQGAESIVSRRLPGMTATVTDLWADL